MCYKEKVIVLFYGSWFLGGVSRKLFLNLNFILVIVDYLLRFLRVCVGGEEEWK